MADEETKTATEPAPTEVAPTEARQAVSPQNSEIRFMGHLQES